MIQLVKNPPAMRETWIQSLGWEDPLEKEMATHSLVFLPEEFHGQRSLAGYSPWVCKELDMTEQLTLLLEVIYHHFFLILLVTQTNSGTVMGENYIKV